MATPDNYMVDRDVLRKRKQQGQRPVARTAEPMLESGTGLVPPPKPAQTMQPTRPAAATQAPAAPVPPVVDAESRMRAIQDRSEQARLRGLLRDKQTTFRTLGSPEERDAARGEMENIRAAHRGLSARNAPAPTVQTEQEVQMRRAQLGAALFGQLQGQRQETAGRLNEMTTGAGLRQSSVDAGARMAPGIAGYRFSDPRDQFNQRDTLAIAGRTPQQVDWNGAFSPSPAEIARSEERGRLRERMGQIDNSLGQIEAGTIFGPRVSQEQLNAEGQNAAAQRQATIGTGEAAMSKIASERAERERVQRMLRENQRLQVEASNAGLQRDIAGQGTGTVADQTERTRAEAGLVQAKAELDATRQSAAVQAAGIGDPTQTAARIGDAARMAMQSLDPSAINQVREVELQQIEQVARTDPQAGVAMARGVLAALPSEKEVAEMSKGIGEFMRRVFPPTAIGDLQSGRALRQRAIAQSITEIRNRMRAIVAGQSPAGTSGTAGTPASQSQTPG